MAKKVEKLFHNEYGQQMYFRIEPEHWNGEEVYRVLIDICGFRGREILQHSFTREELCQLNYLIKEVVGG